MGRRDSKKVDDMDNKELKKKITSLVKNLNSKRRKFAEAGFKDDFEHKLNTATKFAEPKATLTLESGNLSYSDKEFNKLSDLELKKLYTNLYRVQNTGSSTVKKYKEDHEKVLTTVIKKYVEANDSSGVFKGLDDADKREVLEKYYRLLKERAFGTKQFGSGSELLLTLQGYAQSEDVKEELDKASLASNNQWDYINKNRVNVVDRNGNER